MVAFLMLVASLMIHRELDMLRFRSLRQPLPSTRLLRHCSVPADGRFVQQLFERNANVRHCSSFTAVLDQWRLKRTEHLSSAAYEAATKHRVDGVSDGPLQSTLTAKAEADWLDIFCGDDWLDDNTKYNACHWACEVGDLALLQWLRANDVRAHDATAADSKANLPLHYATQSGHVFILRAMDQELSCVPDWAATGYLRKTVHHFATDFGRVPVMRFLAEEKRLIDGFSVMDVNGHTPSHGAAIHGHVDALAYLKQLGVPILHQDRHGRSSVHSAAEEDKADVIEFYAKNVSMHCVEASDEYGATPAHYAARRGNLAALKRLHSIGASVDKPDLGGRTPLFWIALSSKAKSKHKECLSFLIKEAKADMRHKDSSGRNARDAALEVAKRKMGKSSGTGKFVSTDVVRLLEHFGL